MKNKNNLFVSGISGLLVMLLIVLVRFVDVRPIGPEGTSIGLSRLNGFFFRLSGVIILWYHITDWLGVDAILPGFSEKHDEHRLKPHKMDIPRHNYLFQMRDDESSSKSLFYGISYDIIVTFSRIQDSCGVSVCNGGICATHQTKKHIKS